MSQVIVVNDLSNLGEQLKAALAGSGIDASQFGDIGAQIQKALADAGLVPQMASAAVQAPVVEKEPEHTFGELLSFEEDEEGWHGEYYVKGATEINIYPDDNGDVQIELLNKYAENNGDVFSSGGEFDLTEIGALVDGDILYVTIPKYAEYEPFRNVDIEGFDPSQMVEAGEDADDEPCDCEGCKYDRV